ncbi:hypothetical protein C8J57DRAFT_1304132 [Mycena rebaudengoi]|nr:hypothetical protein C8J57DRAFT_1304132 [Mycena rebaudengoi]
MRLVSEILSGLPTGNTCCYRFLLTYISQTLVGSPRWPNWDVSWSHQRPSYHHRGTSAPFLPHAMFVVIVPTLLIARGNAARRCRCFPSRSISSPRLGCPYVTIFVLHWILLCPWLL